MITLATLALLAFATPSAPIPIWPAAAPGEKGEAGEERDNTTDKDALISGRRVIRLGNVHKPTITVYRPPKDKDTGAAVIVFPGGGYRILALDLEGSEICEWLNTIGVTGILLKYRVPSPQGTARYTAPLQDAQRTIGLVRQHAAEWGLNPKRIGVLGFSAGGHLAAASSTNYDSRTYDPLDAADSLSSRPDFTVLIYPAYLVQDKSEQISPELKITAQTSPTFIVQTEDDPVHVENSIFYYAALKNAKVPAEMHLFAAGGHGYGLRPSDKSVSEWPRLAEKWMRSLGLLSRP